MRDPIRPISLPPPPPPSDSSAQPAKRKRSASKTIRVVGSILRSFPIISTASCKLPSSRTSHVTKRIICTLYGHKKGYVTLSLQDSPGSHPSLVLELPVLTHTLHKELRSGSVRVSLVCEKKPVSRCRLMEESVWSAFWNGRENGLGVRRDANDADLNVMELLKVVSMGVGAVPGVKGGEVAYIRATFEHVVGSKDSESLYMLTPEGNNASELTIFFVRT